MLVPDQRSNTRTGRLLVFIVVFLVFPLVLPLRMSLSCILAEAVAEGTTFIIRKVRRGDLRL